MERRRWKREEKGEERRGRVAKVTKDPQVRPLQQFVRAETEKSQATPAQKSQVTPDRSHKRPLYRAQRSGLRDCVENGVPHLHCRLTNHPDVKPSKQKRIYTMTALGARKSRAKLKLQRSTYSTGRCCEMLWLSQYSGTDHAVKN